MLSASYFAQQLINGIVLGSMYSLLALGMTVVYGILRLINFAHGAFVMLGAFFIYFLTSLWNVPFPLALVALAIFGGVMGVFYDTVGFRKLRGRGELPLLITSLGIYIFLENLAKMIFSPQSYAFSAPDYFYDRISLGNVSIANIDVFTIASSIIIVVAFSLFLRKTKVGIAMRATAEDLEAARMMGINIDKVILTAFIIGTAIAALTGFMWGAKYSSIQYNIGFMIGVKAFVAVVIGGLGSVAGSMLGGYILGIAEILTVGLLPPGYAPYRDGIVFTLLVIILLTRPSGLLGQKEEVRI